MPRPSKRSKDDEVFGAIRAFIDEHGISPAIHDLMKMLNFRSANTVSYYLNRLEEEGLISRQRRLSRSIVILSSDPSVDRKKQAAGKKGRGIDAMRSVRPDANLDARIEFVVQQAQERSRSGLDVVNGPVAIRLSGLKANRIG